MSDSIPTDINLSDDDEICDVVKTLIETVEQQHKQINEQQQKIDSLYEDHVPIVLVKKVLLEYGVPAKKVESFINTIEEVDDQWGDDNV